MLGGDPNESLSGRSHRENWRIKRVINKVFFWEVDHCKSAFENDAKWAVKYLQDYK